MLWCSLELPRRDDSNEHHKISHVRHILLTGGQVVPYLLHLPSDLAGSE